MGDRLVPPPMLDRPGGGGGGRQPRFLHSQSVWSGPYGLAEPAARTHKRRVRHRCVAMATANATRDSVQ